MKSLAQTRIALLGVRASKKIFLLLAVIKISQEWLRIHATTSKVIMMTRTNVLQNVFMMWLWLVQAPPPWDFCMVCWQGTQHTDETTCTPVHAFASSNGASTTSTPMVLCWTSGSYKPDLPPRSTLRIFKVATTTHCQLAKDAEALPTFMLDWHCGHLQRTFRIQRIVNGPMDFIHPCRRFRNNWEYPHNHLVVVLSRIPQSMRQFAFRQLSTIYHVLAMPKANASTTTRHWSSHFFRNQQTQLFPLRGLMKQKYRGYWFNQKVGMVMETRHHPLLQAFSTRRTADHIKYRGVQLFWLQVF